MKDLINDEEEEEEQEDSEDDVKKRKHRDEDSASDDLDEEDLALLKENLGDGFVQKPKKFKRVKRIADEDSDDEPTDAKKKIENELFDGENMQMLYRVFF